MTAIRSELPVVLWHLIDKDMFTICAILKSSCTNQAYTMSSSQIIYSDSIQDRLENLSEERLDRVSGIASKYLGTSKTRLYKLIINDEIVCAIDEQIANVLSEAFVRLEVVK